MPIQLLQTKLFIPPPHAKLLARPGLTARLESALALGQRLVLVSALAGSGKTSVVSEWLFRSKRKAAWLSLDEEDNQLVRFWSYVAAALQTVRPALGQEMLAMLQSPSSGADDGSKTGWVQSLLTGLINEISSSREELVLVLDDYHAIHLPGINQCMAYLLEHLPPQMLVVVITRSDPPFSLTRLRARRQMTELRVADLRFREDETATFLNGVMQLDLLPQDVSALEQRTEGWAAGLQLAALSMQDRRDRHQFISAFTGGHHFILEYLTEEVLNQQPGMVQDFLLRTSILDRMCASLCDAVLFGQETGETGGDLPAGLWKIGPVEPERVEGSAVELGAARSVLDHLQHNNLFLIPLDDELRWYRYHHLFADLLKKRLRQEHTPEDINELHRRAGVWFEQNGFLDEAMKHLLAGRDYDRAAALVEACSPLKLTRGEMGQLMEWYRALPEEQFQLRPRLCVGYCITMVLCGQLERLDTITGYIRAVLDSSPETPDLRDVRGTLMIMQAFKSDMAGDSAAAFDYIHQAESLLAEDNYLSRSIIPFTQGRAHRAASQLEEAVQAFNGVVQVGRMGKNIWTMAVGSFEIATTRKLQGRLREAETVLLDTLRLADDYHARHFGSVAKVTSSYCDLLREQNRLDEARAVGEDALKSIQWWGNPSDFVMACVFLARVYLASGELARVEELLARADRVCREQFLFSVLNLTVDAVRVRLWLARGELAEVERWSQTHPAVLAGDHVSYDHLTSSHARIMAAREEWEAALALLETAIQDVETGGRFGRLIELLVLRARILAQQAGGSEPEGVAAALANLEQALCLAEPEGFVRVFLDEGQPVETLLRVGQSCGRWAERGLEDYARRLLVQFEQTRHNQPDRAEAGKDESGGSSQLAGSGAGVLVEPLSEREAEILNMICDGLSNQEIADRLVVALNTVKKHTSNIFGKLGVNSRTQAVAAARKLGLV